MGEQEVEMDLYRDWIETVRVVFRGSGHPLPEELPDEEVARLYYQQTATDEQAETMAAENASRLRELQRRIEEHLDSVIVPDIRQRTGYTGSKFKFRWVYQRGEHIVEEYSKYRIPLGGEEEEQTK